MARPIPVFAFVFAAYSAVTSGTSVAYESARAKPTRRSPSATDKMLETWRNLQSRSISVSAQVLAPKTGTGTVTSIWLKDVIERDGTLTGLRAESYEGTAARAADRISFSADDVLSWRMAYDAASRAESGLARHLRACNDHAPSPTEFA